MEGSRRGEKGCSRGRGFSGKVVGIFVEDTGTGIPSEVSLDQSPRFQSICLHQDLRERPGAHRCTRHCGISRWSYSGGIAPPDKGHAWKFFFPAPHAVACWDWENVNPEACRAVRDMDCADCEMRRSGTGFCCWTLKGRAHHAETGQWPDRCLSCGLFRSSSLTPFFRSRVIT